MAIRVYFPIRAKLLILMSTVVVIAILSYLALATKLFTDDKALLVYELNASHLRTLAAEVEAELSKTSDKVKLLTQVHGNPSLAQSILGSDPDLLAYRLHEASKNGQDWIAVATGLSPLAPSPLDIHGLEQSFPIPFGAVLEKKGILENLSNDTTPLYRFSMELKTKENGRNTILIATTYLKLEGVLKRMQGTGIAMVYLINDAGQVLIHPDKQTILQRTSMDDVSLVQDALNSKLGLEMKHFEWQGKKWIGSYHSIPFAHVTVLSQIPESEIFRATRQLINKSALLALLLVTLTLFFTTRLAKSLSEPLRKLVTATQEIKRWNFDQTIAVKTNDEIGLLATSFNDMAYELQRQRKQIEAHQADLERKVKERTAALEAQKKKASQAQEALVRTTRLASLGEMAGMAAHEILNPLNNISIRIQHIQHDLLTAEENDTGLFTEIVQGWKDAYTKGGWTALQSDLTKSVSEETGDASASKKTLLEEDLENLRGISGDLSKRREEKRDGITFILGEIGRITKMINNMRSIARVGGVRKAVNIHEPIESTLAAMGEFLQARQIQVVKKFSNFAVAEMTLQADPDELVQVFSNLFRNAAQSMEEKNHFPKTLEIATQLGAQDKRIEIRIRDEGTGIQPQHLDKIFETDFTTKTLEKGTGLGLSISRRLVRAFSGEISVETTTPGKGTTFLVWFPSPNKES